MALPIMGPPSRTLSTSSFSPPAASTRAETGVPTRQRKLLGAATPGPETVTTRWMEGIPSSTRQFTLQQVKALKTMQATSAGSPPGGTCRPVTL